MTHICDECAYNIFTRIEGDAPCSDCKLSKTKCCNVAACEKYTDKNLRGALQLLKELTELVGLAEKQSDKEGRSSISARADSVLEKARSRFETNNITDLNKLVENLNILNQKRRKIEEQNG